ncbi:MAG: hypothetical protein HOI95_07030 [Chromatiales bacterium]|jgi:hypothetical protein|nr:hypothetical protein [Chromatiales bacterium]
MSHILSVMVRVGQRNLSVAAVFWTLWLVLVIGEIALGSSLAIGIIYWVSIPMLVGFMTVSSLRVLTLVDLQRRVMSVSVLGMTVLVSASLTMSVGIVATSSLKFLSRASMFP